MKHSRDDYNGRFVDLSVDCPEILPEGAIPIAEDEPVLILRAKDKFFIPMVDHYRFLVAQDLECSQESFSSLLALAIMGETWQARNGSKTPDIHSPKEVMLSIDFKMTADEMMQFLAKPDAPEFAHVREWLDSKRQKVKEGMTDAF